MPSPYLLPPPLSLPWRLASSPFRRNSPPSPIRTPSPIPTPRLTLRALHARASGGGGDGLLRGAAGDGGGRVIPIARCYEGALARLEVSGGARREQAVAAAAAADGGKAAEAHLEAGSGAMVIEAFLPGAAAGGGAASTRVILQAMEVKEKASKIKKDFGADFFSENEPDSESMLAMALKQVVMEQLSDFRVEIFSPGSERDFQDRSKPQKVPVDFSISSSDGKLLSALTEAIFSCVVEDVEKNFLGRTGSLFQMRKLNCSYDSTVCIHRISEAEIANNARRCLESFNLVKSSHEVGIAKKAWWPAPKYERLADIGGPDFILWAHEFVPSYKLQINAKAFEDTKLAGWHELANNRQEILISHIQLVELGNVLDMYFEDQFTLPGKTFHSHWNAEPSKIKSNNVYLNNLFVLLAGSCVILTVGIIAQLCWPQTLKDKRFFIGSSSPSSSQKYCSDIHSLDNSEVVMSEEGKLVGFQPTSRLAVNHWATNPLAALLYDGRKLSPDSDYSGLRQHLPIFLLKANLAVALGCHLLLPQVAATAFPRVGVWDFGTGQFPHNVAASPAHCRRETEMTQLACTSRLPQLQTVTALVLWNWTVWVAVISSDSPRLRIPLAEFREGRK